MSTQPGNLDDWVAETSESIAARLESAQSAQNQARRTIGFMSMIAMMMLIASYNAYLSYDSNWILGMTHRHLDDQERIADVLTSQALKDWAASRSVQVSLLGIRISVDDAPVLGTATLLVMALWLLLLTRRENHTVGLLLRDTDTNGARERSGQRWLIFHTVASNSLFVACDRSLSPVESLGGPNPLSLRPDPGVRVRMRSLAFSFVGRFFFDFPAVVCAIVFTIDRWSYLEPDAFAVEAQAPGMGSPFFWFSLGVFVMCWVPLVLCCRYSYRYSTATERVLREYGYKLRADLLHGQREVASQGLWNQSIVSLTSG